MKDPATNAPLATVSNSNASTTQAAIAHANAAFLIWKDTLARERSRILRRWRDLLLEHKEDLAMIATAECGKPIAEARGEVEYSAAYFEWFAEEAVRINGDIIPTNSKGRRVLSLLLPHGVAALITPWNFPLAMLARKIAPALAAGNTVVAKPAPETPLSALAMAWLGEQAGVRKGVLNVVPAEKARSGAIGTELMKAGGGVRKVSFTGSVGQILMQQAAVDMKRLSLELGGNAPFIVFSRLPVFDYVLSDLDDADLDLAVKGCIQSKFRNSGQTCVCVNRIYVQDGVHDEFVRKLKDTLDNLKMGNGFDPTVALGPLITPAAVEKVEDLVADAVSKGARAEVWERDGKAREGGGNFANRAVVTGMQDDMRIASEEVFGPVAPVFRFKSESEVLARANASVHGLAGYVYTSSMSRMVRMAERLEVGMIGVNEGLISTEVAPFGGWKMSGMGREGSVHGIREWVERRYRQSYVRELKSHFGCVNAIAFSNDGEFLASGGDDTRVLLWRSMQLEDDMEPIGGYLGHESNIFCISFGRDSSCMYSCGNDGLLIKHNTEIALSNAKSSVPNTLSSDRIFAHDGAALKVSVNPENDSLLATAGQDGFVKLWDMRSTSKPAGGLASGAGFNAVVFNPVSSNLFLTASDDGKLLLYDMRIGFESPGRFHLSKRAKSVMKYSTRMTSWRPILYSMDDEAPIAVIRSEIDGVRFNGTGDAGRTVGRRGCSSSCTVKSCAFAPDLSFSTYRSGRPDDGNLLQELFEAERRPFGEKPVAVFASGSDDFRCYGWTIPAVAALKDRRKTFRDVAVSTDSRVLWHTEDGSSYEPFEINREDFALEGHRSIVNSVIFHPHLPIIATAGVEKLVRLHSPYPMLGSRPENQQRKPTRVACEHSSRRRLFLNLFGTEETMEEDSATLAEFDYLIQTEAAADRLWRTTPDSDDSDTDSQWETESDGEGESEVRIEFRGDGGDEDVPGIVNDADNFDTSISPSAPSSPLLRESEEPEGEPFEHVAEGGSSSCTGTSSDSKRPGDDESESERKRQR
ncbi:hypothetical protein HDU96_007089 [Phlyctochytrium bullatum]|nr:hypothetical protein HDU96_007089 [Phlyctochytrium bullatum]